MGIDHITIACSGATFATPILRTPFGRSTGAGTRIFELVEELANWTYKPGGGVRLLGIPCVRDRVVQATLKRLLEPLLTPTFSDHSFGFIPNRNQGQAVKEAQRIVRSGKEWIVDIDLSKFFDSIFDRDRCLSFVFCGCCSAGIRV